MGKRLTRAEKKARLRAEAMKMVREDNARAQKQQHEKHMSKLSNFISTIFYIGLALCMLTCLWYCIVRHLACVRKCTGEVNIEKEVTHERSKRMNPVMHDMSKLVEP